MKETSMEIGGYANCCLTRTEWGGGVKDEVSLDYLERATDHYSSDTETSVDIDEAEALKIIGFLKESFNLK